MFVRDGDRRTLVVIDNLKLAWSLLAREQRKTFLVLLLIMMLMAVLETASIGLLLPFIGIVNSPDLVFQNAALSVIYRASGLGSPREFLVAACFLLVILFLGKNLLQLFLQFVQARALLNIQVDIERRLMRSYLAREYLFFVEHNPAELYQNIRNVSGIMSLLYTPALLALAEFIVLVMVTAFLVAVQPVVTLTAACLFGSLAFLIFRFTRRRAALYGEQGNQQSIQMNKWMFQTFGGIKEIKLISKEGFFLDRSMHYSAAAAWTGLKGGMLSQIARPVVESVWLSMAVLLIAGSLMMGGEGKDLIPVLALLAAAAFRIMPAITRMVNAAISVRQANYHINAVALELHSKHQQDAVASDDAADTGFGKSIRLDDLSFRYKDSRSPALAGISLDIAKGQSVALVGPSGAGKTTVVDILLGLLARSGGDIVVDGQQLPVIAPQSWRARFGYVPQTIYLSDDTVRRNIAFGEDEDKIDDGRLQQALRQAQLHDVVYKLPLGLETVVGDRGAKLSGGQRQRIGIARALYRNPEILILDEATSALDNETEREITQAIKALSGQKTVILIAHRLSTVIHCDLIYFLVNGRVEASGSFEELLRTNEKFRRFADAG